jgi:hypothetical protein
MNKSTKDIPKDATEDILSGVQNFNNSFAIFDKVN